MSEIVKVDGSHEMDERTDRLFNTVFDRLRETEAQTREQTIALNATNQRVSDLCDQLRASAVITDKFLALEEKRSAEAEKRFDKLWNLIVYLVGAVIALALGPKAIDKFYEAYHSGAPVAYVSPIYYNNDRTFQIGRHISEKTV